MHQTHCDGLIVQEFKRRTETSQRIPSVTPELHLGSLELFTLTTPRPPPTAGTVFATAGIHPCSSSIFSPSHHKHHDESQSEGEGEAEHTPACDPDPSKPIPDGDGVDNARSEKIIADLTTLISSARSPSPFSSTPELVAFGEFGLDYDRLHYCSKEVQLHSFAVQLALAASLSPQLPLFLHSRAAHADFVRLLKDAFGPRLERLEKGGVVHSFTGTVDEMRELMDLGLYIGVNGCSFKTEENCAVVKEIELSRLMLETDGPWCEVRPSHGGGGGAERSARGRKSDAFAELDGGWDGDDDNAQQQGETWRPRVKLTFHGSHVFAGIRQLVECGIIDGERMPGWMTGEEGVTIGAVRHGRIRGHKGSGL